MATSIDNSSVLIDVQGLRKEYNGGAVVALNSCDLQVKRGEVVSIIGPPVRENPLSCEALIC
ncbi:MAG: hypothetical protein J6S18_04800, partial [Oscillospiraceae bacterium]|nr:hypothetical protein [Oscillospiraceae bacterium]